MTKNYKPTNKEYRQLGEFFLSISEKQFHRAFKEFSKLRAKNLTIGECVLELKNMEFDKE